MKFPTSHIVFPLLPFYFAMSVPEMRCCSREWPPLCSRQGRATAGAWFLMFSTVPRCFRFHLLPLWPSQDVTEAPGEEEAHRKILIQLDYNVPVACGPMQANCEKAWGGKPQGHSCHSVSTFYPLLLCYLSALRTSEQFQVC